MSAALELNAVLLSVAISGLMLIGCSESEHVQNNPERATGKQIQTTDSEIAFQNLNVQIAGHERSLRLHPRSIDTRLSLSHLLLERTLLFGTYERDFARMEELSKEAIKIDPSVEESKLLSAQVSSVLHRFGRAKEVLSELQDPQRMSQEVQGILNLIAVATGDDLSEIVKQQESRVATRPSFSAMTDLAITEASLGHFEKADQLYEHAIALYRDSSPFPLAVIAFQRGLMWCEMAAQCERAIEFYREAVERVPQYVNANVHLAELEAQAGKIDDAIARLRSLVRTSDPEPLSLLAELLIQQGRSSEARQLIARSSEGYAKLLARHEEAFRDHATEYFLSLGNDKELALQLARANLENRKDDRAYLLALEAAEQTGQFAYICELVEELSTRGAPKSVPLIKKLEKVSENCS